MNCSICEKPVFSAIRFAVLEPFGIVPPSVTPDERQLRIMPMLRDKAVCVDCCRKIRAWLEQYHD